VQALQGQEGETEVVISDTGPGIPQTVIERMFNPFFTTRATGTGLGLAIVHRILDAHGGRVVVNGNRTGSCGAEVRLVLPRHDAAVNAEAA
jgi:signal transduction histidine kinase